MDCRAGGILRGGGFAASYANSVLAKMEAVLSGYGEAILLNGAGPVAERPGEKISRTRKDAATSPASSGILRGITRDTILRCFPTHGGGVCSAGQGEQPALDVPGRNSRIVTSPMAVNSLKSGDDFNGPS